MAKQQQSIRQRQIDDNGRHGNEVELTINTDDYPLPNTEELQRLKSIDPTIIPWMLQRAEKEQLFRHENKRLNAEMSQRLITRETLINLLGLTFAFAIIAVGLYLSYCLIIAEKSLFGSIFTGATLLAAASIFIKLVRKPKV